ncbi:MAG TPA: tetratricopeptide repeat protein [Chryseolinea sp.]|nr:tetratricopeptide repeat protein [Chryseolinea sp.]HPM31911.1 tetratricopeptide repeat protein [Chryseolinea sp.]
MRYLIYLTLMLTSCSTSGQRELKSKQQDLTEDQVINRYLENGAWRLRYFSPEYQVYVDSAIALNPGMAYLYQQKAMPYFKQGKYELGLKSLDKAVDLDPKSHIDYRAFIKCIFAKTYQDAIKDFLTAKKIKGENGFVMDHSYDFYMGVCYLQLNDFQKSLDYLERSIEHTRKANGESWIHSLDLLYAGIASQELNQHEKAIQFFDQALQNYPTFSDAKYYKSISLFRTDQIELAEKTLIDCENDFKSGYTINEDNAVYEKYPYQIKQFYIDVLKLTKR